MAILGNTTATELDVANNITANKIIKTGGSSSQFLKADGSVDSNTYLKTSEKASTAGTADKVTNSLTITNLSGEKKTFDGSSQVDVSSGVNLAAKANALSKSITVSGGVDVLLSFSTDGSSDVTANIGFPTAQVSCENKDSDNYKRFACLYADNDSSVPKGEVGCTSNDYCGLFFVGKDYTGSGKQNHWGILRVALRTQTAGRYLAANWVVRTFTNNNWIYVQRYDNNSDKVGVDLFVQTNDTWDNWTIRCINQGGRGSKTRFRMLDSMTSAYDKPQKELYASLEAACTAIHGPGTTYTESIAPTDIGVVNNISGILSVQNGGTGCNSFETKGLLFGDGTNKITTKAIKNITSKSYLEFTKDTDEIPTVNALLYWNGTYNADNKSNLEYCSQGKFGTIVTVNKDDNASKYLNGTGNWTTPPNTQRTIKIDSTSINNNELNLKSGTGISLKNDKGTVTINASTSSQATKLVTEQKPSLYKNAWGASYSLPTDKGTYVIQIIDTTNSEHTNAYSGVFTNYGVGGEEIILHANLDSTVKRIFAKTSGSNLLLSSEDTSSTTHTITINLLRLI